MEEQILQQIKINKLEQFDEDFLIAQLCVLNNTSFNDIKKIVDKLILQRRISVRNKDVQDVMRDRSRKSVISKTNKGTVIKNTKTKSSKNRIDGKIAGTKKGYAFLVPFDSNEKDIFISEKNLNGAVNNDKVIIEVVLDRKRREGRVIQILERGNGSIVGKIKLGKVNAFVTPDDVKFGKDIYVPMSKVLGANDGDKVLVKIERYYSDRKLPDGVVTEVLGPENDIKVQVLSCLRNCGLFEGFPKKVLSLATEMPTVIDVKKYPDRKDRRNELIFTIDGADTRDIDDAISLKKLKSGNYLLGVYIADVGEYVPRGSIIDDEAFKRGTSVYFPGMVLPMLPKELSNGICSLNPNVDRLTLSVEMEIDKNGDIVNHDIFEGIIRSKKQFTYHEVQNILEKEENACKENSEFVETLWLMDELAKLLKKKRIQRGEITLDLPEAQIVLTETGDVSDIYLRAQDDSHKLIESFMIAANETIATHYFLKKAPFLYRVHEKPDAEKIDNFVRIAEIYGVKCNFTGESFSPKNLQKALDQINGQDFAFSLNRICLRSQKKAKYMPQCLGHFALASKYYCHFTSPIRRYPDLTIHRIIKEDLHGQLKGRYLAEDKQFVVASGFQSSDREVNAESVEREVDSLYKALYMDHRIGEEFNSIISSVTSFGIFVELENTVEGLVPLEELPDKYYTYDEENFMLVGQTNSYKLGDRIKVKCSAVSIPEHKINFSLV